MRAVNCEVTVSGDDIEGVLRILKRRFFDVLADLNKRKEPKRGRRLRAKRTAAEKARLRIKRKKERVKEMIAKRKAAAARNKQRRAEQRKAA